MCGVVALERPALHAFFIYKLLMENATEEGMFYSF